MSRRGTITLIVSFIAIFMPASLELGRAEEAQDGLNVPVAKSLRKHPIYSTYQFAGNEKIINFGSQPLAVFMGSLGELMRRDAILHEELAKLGCEIRIHAFLKGADLGFFIREGDVQGGMLGDMPTLSLAVSTKTIIPALSGEGFASIVAPRGTLITDLKGKRVGVAFGSAAHAVLLEALRSEGVDPEEIRPVFMDGARMPEALKKGDVYAFAGWEPLVSAALQSINGYTIIHRGRYAGFTCFREDFVDKNPEAAELILAAQVRGLRYIWDSEKGPILSCLWAVEEARRLVGPSYNVTPELLAEIIMQVRNMNIIPIIPATDLAPNGHLEKMFVFLKSLGFVPDRTQWKSVRRSFDRSRMIRVLQDPKKYRIFESRYRIEATP